MDQLVRLRRGRGTSEVRYRCSVPGLAGFAASRLHGVRSLIKIADLTINPQSTIRNPQLPGGEGGIRTHGTVSRTQHFQCCQLSRSCTSPKVPIADLRLPIQIDRGTSLQSAIANRQSKIIWRRGWDSNPRYPCGYNGFRDRPIQPLSHLSACYCELRLSRKKDCSTRRHSPSRIPPSTLT